MTISARNVELKARDPDPARTLERALSLGAEDQGTIQQRDTYFAGARGRIKLREQAPGGAQATGSAGRAAMASAELVEYRRADSPGARTSAYRRVPVADAAALGEALDAAYGTLVVVEKRRRLLTWKGVRIHLDEVEGLGSHLELEAVADAGSDLAAEHEQVERLRVELGIEDGDLVAGSYSDLLQEGPERLLAAADEVMRNAHSPYSRFRVGAALRTPDGRLFTGANVENAAHPQGQCAEASALGALVAAGETEVAEVAVVAERMDVCPPCGGCRQRLAEFARPETPVHLGRPGGERRTVTVGELLPLAFDLDAGDAL